LTLLSSLKRLKQAKGSSTPRLRLNYTVNPDNLAELQNFFDVFGEFEVETLQVRPIIDLGKVAYTKKDMTPFLTRYNEILDSLAKECSQGALVFFSIDGIRRMQRPIPTHRFTPQVWCICPARKSLGRWIQDYGGILRSL
jgi:hypothetical protein